MMKLIEIQDNNTLEFHRIKVHQYKVEYNKHWGTQERNLVGSIRGTLVGISANIEAKTDYLNQEEVELMGRLLNQPYFSVRFFDTLSNTTKEADYTASDMSAEIVRLNNREYRAIDFTLAAVDMQVS